MQQVVLLASGTESVISSWDLHTGTQLSSFKNNAAPRNCMCRAGDDYLVAAQASKDALQFWTWHKDQVLQRSFAMERMSSVAAAPGGVFLAAGGLSGAIYIWELPSGRLLRTWPAHYKAVTCLAFTSHGDMLVSGSEDTLVSAWLMAEMLDCQQDTSAAAQMRPQPLHSWSHHTLPVTGLHVTSGGCQASSLVASSSLDRSVKVHSLGGDGPLLAAAQLPCAALCVTLDAGEHVMYAGGADGGVYEFSLVGEMTEVDGTGGAGGRMTVDGAADLALGGSAHAVLRPHACMTGHGGAVNALSVSVDGELLVSGSEDGTAQVWHLRSRQATHVLQAPSKLPVTCVMVTPKPPHLTAGGGGGTATGARTGPKRLAPLAPLVKYVGMSGALKPWESAPVVLDGSNLLSALSTDGEVPGLTLFPPAGTEQAWLTRGLQGSGWQGATGQGDGLQGSGLAVPVQLDGVGGGVVGAAPVKGGESEVAALRMALAAAQQEAQSWRTLHAQLHAHCVQQTVSKQ